jgi:hypothetical protein
MRCSPLLVLLIFLLLPVLAAAQAGKAVQVRGSFQEGIYGIAGATITVLQNSRSYTTDSNGRFSMDLAPGGYTFVLSHVAFRTETLQLHLMGDTSFTVWGNAGGKALQEVVIISNANRSKVRSTQVGVEAIDRKSALLLPAIMGEVDVIKVFQLKPGVKSSGEGSSGLSVRGGGTDQNLFLFDGTPVYNPAHLFGFFSTFNIDAVKDVQLYKAGFPAEFSGRLSSIVDVASLKGTDSGLEVGGGIVLISSRLNVQGNLLRNNKKGKKLTYNIAARRTYADVFTRMLNKANERDPEWTIIPDYYFYDANARIDYQISDKDLVYASVYYGRDHFKLSRSSFGSTFSWGNTAASLHWLRRIKPGFSSDLSLHFSDYNYRLKTGFSRFELQLGSGVQEYSINQKLTYHRGDHVFTGGYSAGYTTFSIAGLDFTSSDEDENLSSGELLNGIESGIFVADEWAATPSLSINAGLRLTLFHNKKTYAGLEPRISVRQMLNERMSLKASYARMQQYRHLVASSGASLPTDIWYPSTAGIPPELSDQVSLGFSWNIGNRFLITNEVYYKWMRQLVDYKPGANLIVNTSLEDEFVFGRGESYGAEITIEKTSGKLRGWIGYTLAKTTRQFDDINGGRPFYPRYDRRHELSVVATYPLTPRITLSGSWTLYTGNAVTLPTGRTIIVGAPGTTNPSSLFSLTPVYPERGNYRMPNYHRLDLGIVYKLNPKRGTSDLTFSAYNAYSRLNPYFISFEEAKTTSGNNNNAPANYEAKAITLFPIIPSITYNFRF